MASRKQGHLEAGKRRLEEFRKKKSEERAKRIAFTAQSQLPDVSQHEKLPNESGAAKLLDSDGAAYEKDGIADTQSSGPIVVHETKTTDASPSINLDSSNVTTSGSHTSANQYNTIYDDFLEKSLNYQEPRGPDGSSSTFLDSSYYNHRRGEMNNKLSASTGTQGEQTNVDWLIRHDTLHQFPNLDDSIQKSSHSLHEAHPIRNKPDKSVSVSLQSNAAVADMSHSHIASIKYDDSTISKTDLTELVPTFQRDVDSHLHFDNARVVDVGGRKCNGGHYPSMDSAPSWMPESFSSQTSLNVKSSFDQSPLHSTISENAIRRSRPSFLDSINVPRSASVSHFPFSDSDKTEKLWPSRSSNVHKADILISSASQPSCTDLETMEPLGSLRTPRFESGDMVSIHSSVSVNNGELPRQNFKDDTVLQKHEFPLVKKDDDFAALEQHIEDLTQEKFSLQRALEASRALAESLAVENSSLTDSFNQQGVVVNQLKSDMERLQEEIQDQLFALESIKMEYANAQLECNAADERAKILASEVIGLEEKALRLRSSELKLERELEKSNAEINSYKRKVSTLEKERRDFQSTIDALQEEKKLLQSKLRKASSNGKDIDIGKAPATTKHASTSTDDLGVEVLDDVDLENNVRDGAVPNTATITESSVSSAFLSSSMTSLPLPQENRVFHFQDVSGAIPPDQLRMIGNINSLISELAVEKEELVSALAVESSNSSKLKDLNKELSQKLEAQTQRLELLTAQHMANDNLLVRPADPIGMLDATQYADEGDEVVERVLGWIMKLFPGGPSRRRTSKLL